MSDEKNSILLETGTNEVEFLEFYLGSGCYGVNVAKVAQVLVFDKELVTELPGNEEPGILGTTMFRESPILVVDLSVMLKIDNSACTGKRLLLVLQFNQRTTAFVVDGINRIQRVSWKDFKQTNETNVGAPTKCITGIVSSDKGITMILDFENLLGQVVPGASPVSHQDDISPLSMTEERDLSILYCEDSAIVQKVALSAFKKAGITNVHIFTSGKDGLEFLQANEGGSVDLIVSDIEMPQMDGLALCRAVKSDPDLKSIPVIFFSSTVTDQMRQKCTSVGASAAFSKPEIDHLIKSIQDVLER